jgi:hypothetical protein
LRLAFYETKGGPGGADHLRSTTGDALAVLKAQDGFRVGYWGHDPVGGAMAAVTYWDGLEYIEKAQGELDRLHQQRAEHGAIADVLNLQLLHTELVGAGAQGWLPKN